MFTKANDEHTQTSKRAVIVLDVGGTTIDDVCISINGDTIGPILSAESPSHLGKDETVAELARIAKNVVRYAKEYKVEACCIAMPAPFDYAAGISHMQHKFQSIYGLKLGELLQEKIGLPVYFINDADAFGVGVGWQQLPDVQRFVALTIGTGLGASFMEAGKNVDADDRIPLQGEVWDLPYKEGILEDYVSAQGVVELYNARSQEEQTSAKVVAELARQGNEHALQAYADMGDALGHGLAEVFAHFAPEKIVFGGKVGQSLDLFQPALERALKEENIPVPVILKAMEGNPALWGAAQHAFSHKS